MPRIYHRTRILCLACALLLLPWHGAQAAPRRAAPSTPKAHLAVGWSSLVHLAWAFVTGELDNGCKMDPNGVCIPLAILQSDNGCQMDPSGKPILETCSGSR